MKIVAAPDKFRGSAPAVQIAAAIGIAAAAYGHDVVELPLADGGEGMLDAFGGSNRLSQVTGPLGAPLTAGWRLEADGRAIIESARASGLVLAGGAEDNDPISATTRGTGELIKAAIEAGASEVLVGLGGSASTDGGRGAVEVLASHAPLDGSELSPPVRVCWDVTTKFFDAAATFGPQKGADPDQVTRLEHRLIELADEYSLRFGRDVRELRGGGAAGGLAGGLAALGAELVAGFDCIAERKGFFSALDEADLVITGEGRLDATSFAGKVVGGVFAAASQRGVPVLVVAGASEIAALPGLTTVSTSERFGLAASMQDPIACIVSLVEEYLARLGGRRRAAEN